MNLANVSRRRLRLRVAVLASLTLAMLAPAAAQETQIKLDPAKTRVEWTLGDVLHTVQGTFQLSRAPYPLMRGPARQADKWWWTPPAATAATECAIRR